MFSHCKVGEYRKYLQLLERISDIEHEKKRASEIISSTKVSSHNILSYKYITCMHIDANYMYNYFKNCCVCFY